MSTNVTSKNGFEVLSYNKLRFFIGVLGMFLPFLLIIGNNLMIKIFVNKETSGVEFQPSISHYYYSSMHLLFVATLCILGAFLITYRGKNNNASLKLYENRLANIAGICAILVAAFPTPVDGYIETFKTPFVKLIPEFKGYIKYVHFGSACLLFICFSIFCLKYFVIPDDENDDAVKRNRRKNIYIFCGYAMLIVMGLFAINNFLFEVIKWDYTVLVVEWLLLTFFGTSWLVKSSNALKNVPYLKALISTIR